MDTLKSSEVARLLRVSLNTVGRWVAQGRLTAIRTPGGQLRISKAEVDALMQPTEKEPVA